MIKSIRMNNNLIRKKICPKCGGALVLHKGKNGFFLLCNNCGYIHNMPSIERKKNLIRNKMSETINNIPNKEEQSLDICDKLFPILNKYSVIALYASRFDEVNLDSLITRLVSLNKTVVLPKVEGNILNFYKVSSLDELIKSTHFNIREPKGDEERLINKEDIEVIVCPGVAFDKSSNRLGRGKGYYDRYLKGTKAYKVGVCYKERLFSVIPHNDNDEKMDLVISSIK